LNTRFTTWNQLAVIDTFSFSHLFRFPFKIQTNRKSKPVWAVWNELVGVLKAVAENDNG